MKCERCEREGAKRRSLVIKFPSIQTEAGFTLCDKCYDYGVDLEPIEYVNDFLTSEDEREPWGPAQ